MHTLKSFAVLTISIFLTLQASTFGQSPLADGEDAREPDSDNGLIPLPKNLEFIILNRTAVEKECNKNGPCWSSDKDFWICGSDDRVYQNPGVLVCSQQCNSSLELEIFCKMDAWSDSFVDDKDHCANCKTRSKTIAAEEVMISTETAQDAKEAAAAAAATAAETKAAAKASPSLEANAIAEEAAAASAAAAADAKTADDALKESIAKSLAKGNPPLVS